MAGDFCTVSGDLICVAGDFGQLNSPATVIKSPASSQNSPASGGLGGGFACGTRRQQSTAAEGHRDRQHQGDAPAWSYLIAQHRDAHD